MQKVGLDPAQIKYIVLSHGHPGQTDHTGGANYLQRTYHPRVMMAKEDWDATLPAQKPERPLAQRDMDIMHGEKLTLGDETLTFTILFGHTPGTLGIFIPVKWHGQSHVVLLHGGGLQHPNRESLKRFESVIKDYALKMNADGILNAHPGIYQDTLADMETIRKNPGGANPLLYGKERGARYWKIMDECATRARHRAGAGRGDEYEVFDVLRNSGCHGSRVACCSSVCGPAARASRAQGLPGVLEGFFPTQLPPGQTTVLHAGAPRTQRSHRRSISCPRRASRSPASSAATSRRRDALGRSPIDVAKDAAPGPRTISVSGPMVQKTTPRPITIPAHVPTIADLKVVGGAGQPADRRPPVRDERDAPTTSAPRRWCGSSLGAAASPSRAL